MWASKRRTKWILSNVCNNYLNMTDYVNRHVATAKARRPKVRRWCSTERRWRLAERRRCRMSVSENDMQHSLRHWGALSCIHRRTVTQSLNCTRSSEDQCVTNGTGHITTITVTDAVYYFVCLSFLSLNIMSLLYVYQLWWTLFYLVICLFHLFQFITTYYLLLANTISDLI